VSRIAPLFKKLGKEGRKALIAFITAGDPDLATTGAIIPLLEEAGADIIELGVPFSDPMADGPTIQLSSERALTSGTSLHGILSTVKKAREVTSVPIVLMGYYNPLLAYGLEQFAADAAAAGVDGVLVVDLPPEESADLHRAVVSHGIDPIYLLTPTSDEARVSKVMKLARGFVYYVSVTGVTGARKDVAVDLSGAVSRIRSRLSVPVAVGFGISTPDQAARVAGVADGVVVGSALVRHFEESAGEELLRRISGFVSSLKGAMQG
jgi:tryptophan synthase alpha chain